MKHWLTAQSTSCLVKETLMVGSVCGEGVLPPEDIKLPTRREKQSILKVKGVLKILILFEQS